MSQQFATYLRSHSSSATKPRLALLDYLKAAHQANTEDMIEALAGVADPASVYRSIKHLQQIGAIIMRARDGQKIYELSDQLGSHHHHLHCIECDSTKSFVDEDLESAIDAAARRNGFDQPSHQVEVSGVCPECR